MTITLYDVRPVSRLGAPRLKVSDDSFTIFFPADLAASLKLTGPNAANVRLGRNPQQKPALVRIYPVAGGDFELRRSGRHGGVTLALPELRPAREPAEVPAEYVVESDGSISIELPQPWTLRSDRAIDRAPAGPSIG
jgi:hypothetical protein